MRVYTRRELAKELREMLRRERKMELSTKEIEEVVLSLMRFLEEKVKNGEDIRVELKPYGAFMTRDRKLPPNKKWQYGGERTYIFFKAGQRLKYDIMTI